MSDLFVANTSAVVRLGGQRVWIRKDVTIVRAGHPILRGRESMFDPVKVHFDTHVEQMTAEPGQKRKVPPPRQSPARRPPSSGPGSGVDAWRRYAAAVTDSSAESWDNLSREEIIELLDSETGGSA